MSVIPDRPEELDPQEFLDLLIRLNRRYYAGDPLISDPEYDELERLFRQKYPEHEEKLPTGTVLDEFEKIEHPIPMGSLGKIRSEEAVREWIDGRGDVIYTPKFDGIAIELWYEHGELVHMATRGDGNEGEDATHIARVLDHVPMIVPEFEDRTILRGEAVLHEEDHPNEARRNLAAGAVKSHDSKVALDRNLKIYVHTLTEFPSGSFDYERRWERLEDLGFLVTPRFDEFENDEEPWFDVPYDVDGVVVKEIDRGRERDAIAYKFPDETIYTTVRDVEFQLGRTGKVTPVLKVEEKTLDNRQLSSINLGSFEILQDLSIGPGDTVEVTFSQDVIPHLKGVVDRTDSDHFGIDDVPDFGTLEMNGSHLYVVDREESKEYRRKRFRSILSGFDIDGLGGEKKTQLGRHYDWDIVGLVRDWNERGDPPTELTSLEGWGSKTVTKIWDQFVDFTQDMTYDDLFGALRLDGFGTKTRRKYLRANENDPFPLTEDRLLATPDVRQKTTDKILESFEENRELAGILHHIATTGQDPSLGVMTKDDRDGVLEGLKIFVTGSLEMGTRSEFKDHIRTHGGEYGKRESNSILVTNDPESTSSKAQYARENDVPIMTESEFYDEFDLYPETTELETDGGIERDQSSLDHWK